MLTNKSLLQRLNGRTYLNLLKNGEFLKISFILFNDSPILEDCKQHYIMHLVDAS